MGRRDDDAPTALKSGARVAPSVLANTATLSRAPSANQDACPTCGERLRAHYSRAADPRREGVYQFETTPGIRWCPRCGNAHGAAATTTAQPTSVYGPENGPCASCGAILRPHYYRRQDPEKPEQYLFEPIRETRWCPGCLATPRLASSWTPLALRLPWDYASNTRNYVNGNPRRRAIKGGGWVYLAEDGRELAVDYGRGPRPSPERELARREARASPQAEISAPARCSKCGRTSGIANGICGICVREFGALGAPVPLRFLACDVLRVVRERSCPRCGARPGDDCARREKCDCIGCENDRLVQGSKRPKSAALRAHEAAHAKSPRKTPSLYVYCWRGREWQYGYGLHAARSATPRDAPALNRLRDEHRERAPTSRPPKRPVYKRSKAGKKRATRRSLSKPPAARRSRTRSAPASEPSVPGNSRPLGQPDPAPTTTTPHEEATRAVAEKRAQLLEGDSAGGRAPHVVLDVEISTTAGTARRLRFYPITGLATVETGDDRAAYMRDKEGKWLRWNNFPLTAEVQHELERALEVARHAAGMLHTTAVSRREGWAPDARSRRGVRPPRGGAASPTTTCADCGGRGSVALCADDRWRDPPCRRAWLEREKLPDKPLAHLKRLLAERASRSSPPPGRKSTGSRAGAVHTKPTGAIQFELVPACRSCHRATLEACTDLRGAALAEAHRERRHRFEAWRRAMGNHWPPRPGELVWDELGSACPTSACAAPVGVYCRRPSGHASKSAHAGRVEAARRAYAAALRARGWSLATWEREHGPLA